MSTHEKPGRITLVGNGSRRSILRVSRYPYRLIPELEVVLTVVELVLELPTDAELVVRSDCHVTPVEKLVNVSSEQEPVINSVFSTFGYRSDMSGLQCRQCPFLRHRTATFVRVSHHDPECTLSQTRSDQRRISVHRPFRSLRY